VGGVTEDRRQKRLHAGELLLPWSGLIAVFLGWALTHQIGSNSNFDKCAATDPLPMAVLGLAGLAILLIGGLLSRKVWKRGEGETSARRFLGLVGTGMCALFATALIFQTISSFIIPQCFA
jgi:drug/metabolite transporter (DMT)-like permease